MSHSVVRLNHRFIATEYCKSGQTVFLDKFSGDWFVLDSENRDLTDHLIDGLPVEKLAGLEPSKLSAIKKLATSGAFEPASRDIEKKISLERHQVTLVIIEALNFCNLACTYCFEDVPLRGKKMSFETAEAIIESVKKLNLAKSFVIEFNGGESFANLPILRHIVKCVEASGLPKEHSISYGMTSNLTLLPQAAIEFIKSNNVGISVSIDGVEGDHDKHRVTGTGKGTHTRVVNNMERLRREGIEFSSISVISEPGQISRAYAYLSSLEVPYVSFAIRRHSDRSPLQQCDYSKIARELVKVFRDSVRKFKKQEFAPKVMDGVILVRNLISPHDPNYMCLRTPCGAGINMITYDTTGDIYACQDLIKEPNFRICDASDPNPQAQIDSNEVVQRLKQRKPGDNKGCEQCDFQMFCQGGCYSTSYYAADNDLEASFRTRTPHCEYYFSAFSLLLDFVASEGAALLPYLESTPYLQDQELHEPRCN